jgi:cysteine desulfurase
MRLLYLDHNATAPLRPQVQERMRALLALPLNASSIHTAGRRARSILEKSRSMVAESAGAFASEVIFTASATEANNLAIKSFARLPVCAPASEHPSVLRAGERADDFRLLPVTPEGVIDINAIPLPASPFLLSVMLANTETGVIQPVREVAERVHALGGFVHCDAVQAYGRIPVDVSALGCDVLTIAAHKMGGPPGAAALIVRSGLEMTPQLHGGAQESRRRAGTENIIAIAGFAEAARLIDFGQMEKLRVARDAMERECAELAARFGRQHIVAGAGAARLPNTSCLIMEGVDAQTQLMRFDLEGMCVSAGSACSSGRVAASHVLRAMGMSEARAACGLRFSGGWNTEAEDFAAASRLWREILEAKLAAHGTPCNFGD